MGKPKLPLKDITFLQQESNVNSEIKLAKDTIF